MKMRMRRRHLHSRVVKRQPKRKRAPTRLGGKENHRLLSSASWTNFLIMCRN
ncbi:hypothetical protein ANCCAN_16449 [Ancylostoma caninum]|uniref:Uncharacterized protein n=1 Tax=Ancylostoma caninum TaxID=29170 RepID=A0A368FZX6_ANCCA|nr:hypothetical protein ANCCAN_16449 [Ancylostoma caninum]